MSPFLDTLAGHYKACPYGPAFTRTVTKAAEALDHETQVRAAESLVRSRKAKGWPSLSECETALANATRAQDTPATERRWVSPEQERADAAADRQRRLDAYRLCRGDLGRQAHRDGWLNALVDWVTDKGRLPIQAEIMTVEAIARRNRASLDALTPSPDRKTVPLGEQAKQYAALSQLYGAMQARAYREVFGFVEERRDAA
jgi:hypothetical protein